MFPDLFIGEKVPMLSAKFSLDCNSPVTAHANGATITFVPQNPSSIVTLSANVTWNSGRLRDGVILDDHATTGRELPVIQLADLQS